jgi:transcriptional regulator with XRE-family HTH domain
MSQARMPAPKPDPEIESWMGDIADRLRAAREARNLSREELTERAGITGRGVIFELEMGTGNVSVRTFLRLAKVLDVDPHELLPTYSPWSKGKA